MEIYPEDLDLELLWEVNPTLAELVERRVPRYMTYPKGGKETDYVMQLHEIGKSNHIDFRFKINNFLHGWSIVGGSIDNPMTPERWLKNKGKGFRCEQKAVQPVVWLKVEGEVKPGEVGAGVEKPGKFTIVSRGKVVLGAQKPYFHEYFVKDGKVFKDWTRIVIRGVRVQKLDPETKKPTGKYETMWRLMIPLDQMPYAISDRAIKKKWKAPVPYPFPLEWTKENFPEQFEKWYEWQKDIEPTKEATVMLAKGEYTLCEHSYMGPVHIRAMPVREWHLLIDDGKKEVMDFKSEDENPLYYLPISVTYEGRIAKKWMEFQGILEPGEHWNPNKKLESSVRILASGACEIEREELEGRERILLSIPSGPMKGEYILEQEEKDSPFYVLGERHAMSLEEESELVEKAFFVYDEHIIDDKKHWDLRFRFDGEGWEFSGMDKDLTELGLEEPTECLLKKMYDPMGWTDPAFKEGHKKVGILDTYVKRIDQGEAIIFNRDDLFWNFMLKGNLFGKEIGGYIVAKKKAPRVWTIMHSALPMLAKTGDPLTGRYYKPFEIVQKRGWDYFLVDIYDFRAFTRMEPEELVKEYFPDLKIPEGVELFIGLYPVPGRLHHARVARVKFPNTWTKEEAFDWIVKNGLHTWSHERIVKRK